MTANAKGTTTKKPITLQLADESFDRARFVTAVGDAAVDLVNAARARKGLPPLLP